MKTLFKSILFVAALLSLAACGNKNQAANDEAAADTENVVAVDTLLANADNYVGQTVTIEGICSHLCKHGGKKAFILGNDQNTMIRCDGTEEMGWAFPAESVHKVLRVTGVVKEQRIGEEEVAAMERQHAEQASRIAAEQGQDVAVEFEQKAAGGCETERKAAGQENIETFAAQMADYRARIAERNAKEGKPYLSFYAIDAKNYEIVEE